MRVVFYLHVTMTDIYNFSYNFIECMCACWEKFAFNCFKRVLALFYIQLHSVIVAVNCQHTICNLARDKMATLVEIIFVQPQKGISIPAKVEKVLSS